MKSLEVVMDDLDDFYEGERRRRQEGVTLAVDNCYAHLRREFELSTPRDLLNVVVWHIGQRISIRVGRYAPEIVVDELAKRLFDAADRLGVFGVYQEVRDDVARYINGEVPSHAPWSDLCEAIGGLNLLTPASEALTALREYLEGD